jgi:uncharacterized protein (TIGR00369 family)
MHRGILRQALSSEPAMTPNPAFIEALQSSVRDAPYPRLLGMRLAGIDFDRCRIELDLDERHMQPFGIVHGGVLATLVDTATFWAGYLRLPQGTGLVNVDLKLNYLKAVTAGTLRTEGTCVRAGRQISVTEATVYDASGEKIAHGLSTLMALPGKDIELGVAKFL